MTRDHVCDMEVDESTAPESIEYLGDVFYFCSRVCREKFEADPERYVSLSEESQT